MRPPQKAAATTASKPAETPQAEFFFATCARHISTSKGHFAERTFRADNSLTDSTLVDNRYAVLELSYLSAILPWSSGGLEGTLVGGGQTGARSLKVYAT